MTFSSKKDLTGLNFGRLRVIRFMPDNTKYSSYLCACDCGVKKILHNFDLTSGAVVSCGCYGKEARAKATTIHGHSGNGKNRTYRSWAAMMDRCHWGGHKINFAAYGAIGRVVCERWHNYVNFLEDMGERPLKTSIDRIDNNGNYQPDNCRWATSSEQALNKSTTLKVIFNGEVVKLKELVKKLGLPEKALRSRAARRSNDYVKALKTFGIESDYCIQ